MKRNIIFTIAVTLVMITVVSLFTACGRGEVLVGAGSVITAGGETILYNSPSGDVYAKSLEREETALLAEDMKVVSAYANEVLLREGDTLVIMTLDGEIVDTIEGMSETDAQLTDDAVYYKNVGDGTVLRLDRAEKDITVALPVAVNKFKFYKNKFVFTTEANNMIFVYDLETGVPTGFFGDKNIGGFDVEGDYLIFSDLNKGGQVYRMNLSGGSEEALKGVKSKTFVYLYGRLFYVENAKGDKDCKLIEYFE